MRRGAETFRSIGSGPVGFGASWMVVTLMVDAGRTFEGDRKSFAVEKEAGDERSVFSDLPDWGASVAGGLWSLEVVIIDKAILSSF